MRWLESEKIFFLITIPPNDTLILNNNLYQIHINFTIIVIHRPTLHLETHYLWNWLIQLV